MNLDKASAAKSSAPLAPPEWTMTMHKESNQFTAEVKHRGVLMCRLSLARPEEDEAAARAKLADKARYWISDYLGRAAT